MSTVNGNIKILAHIVNISVKMCLCNHCACFTWILYHNLLDSIQMVYLLYNRYSGIHLWIRKNYLQYYFSECTTDETETPGGDLKVKLHLNVWEGLCNLAFLGSMIKKRFPNIKDQNLLIIKLLFLLYSEVEHTDPAVLTLVLLIKLCNSIKQPELSTWSVKTVLIQSNLLDLDEANKCFCNTRGLLYFNRLYLQWDAWCTTAIKNLNSVIIYSHT